MTVRTTLQNNTYRYYTSVPPATASSQQHHRSTVSIVSPGATTPYCTLHDDDHQPDHENASTAAQTPPTNSTVQYLPSQSLSKPPDENCFCVSRTPSNATTYRSPLLSPFLPCRDLTMVLTPTVTHPIRSASRHATAYCFARIPSDLRYNREALASHPTVCIIFMAPCGDSSAPTTNQTAGANKRPSLLSSRAPKPPPFCTCCQCRQQLHCLQHALI